MMNVKDLFAKEQATKVANQEAAQAALMAEFGGRVIMETDKEEEGFPLASVARLFFVKGFAENCVTYAEFCNRLTIAQPYAEPAAQALAEVLGCKYIMPEKELSAPIICLPDGEVSISQAMSVVRDAMRVAVEGDKAIYESAINTAQEWWKRTIPSLQRFKSTGTAFDLNGFDDVNQAATRAAIASSNGEVDELRRKYPGEALRAAKLAFEMKDYTNAILNPSREDNEDEETIKDMTDEIYNIYMIAEEIDKMTKAFFKEDFANKLVARNEGGHIIITQKSSTASVKKSIKAAYDAIDWSWDFKLRYISPLYESGIMTYEELYELIGEPLITAEDAERNDGRIMKLDQAIAATVAKRFGFKQTPAGWSPFKVHKNNEGKILKHFTTTVYTNKNVKMTLDATSIYAAVRLQAWSGILDKDKFAKFATYTSRGIATCQRKRGLLPAPHFFGGKGSREYQTLLEQATRLFENPLAADALCSIEEDIVFIVNGMSDADHLGVHAVYDNNDPLDNPRFEGENLWGQAIMEVREHLLARRHGDKVTEEVAKSVISLEEIMNL